MNPSLIFLAAFALALALTPLVRMVALRLGVVDHPERRKMHQMPVPLLGGAAIVLSFTAMAMVLRGWYPEELGDEDHKLPVLLGASLLIGLLGLFDDWKGARVWLKFSVQVAAASLVVAAGVRVDVFTNPLGGSFDIGWLGIPLTIFWIVGVTNAINLIDGLDGLAAGIGTIASLSLCAVGALVGDPLVAILSLVLAGATLGILPYNVYPARIFIGDTGSMFIGFTLASLGALGSLKATTATVLILPIVVLGIPVFDTLWAILRRTHRRVSPFMPDREHIHHRLVRVGLHHRHVVMVLYFICAFLGLSAFIMVQLPNQTAFLFATLLCMGGVLGVWMLKYVEDHLEARLAAASNGASGRVRPSTDPDAGVWQSGNGSRSRAPRNLLKYQVAACEIGVFSEGVAGSTALGNVAQRVQEILGRRLKVYTVGAYFQEDRRLLLIMKLEPLSAETLKMVEGALERFFNEHSGEWGEEGAFPELRWIRGGSALLEPDVEERSRASL